MADQEKAGTNYVVLKVVDTPAGTAYVEVGTGVANNDLAAIKEFLSKGDNGEEYGEGNYRAVPKRSWATAPHEIKRKISFG